MAADSRAGGADSLSFATDPGWTMPFVQRRLANPRYRLPVLAATLIAPGATSRLRALDHFRAQLFHHGFGVAGNTTQWEFQAGEESGSDGGFEVAVGGGYRLGAPELHASRLALRRGAWSGNMGDAEPFAAGRSSLHRLRGLVLRYAGPRQGRWLGFAGVPTPVPRAETPRIFLGGLAAEDIPWDEAWLSVSAAGFWRGPQPLALLPGSTGDTLAGRGAVGTLGWRVPAARGWLAGRLGAQVHGLEGRRSLAAQHALEWTLQSRGLVIALSDERATPRARTLATDRISAAAQREDRWNVQTRFARGRAETHFTGASREGGELALAARTLQVGASGSPGSSPWYAGADAVWDRRELTRSEERRLSVHAGGPIRGGHTVLARLEHARRDGSPDALTALTEASLALPRGTRWTLAPRLGWQDGALRQAEVASHLSWALPWASRITGSLMVGTTRDEGFRAGVREAALALSFSPRLRDRGDVEVRRLELDARPLWETRVAYDALFERHEAPGQDWFASRDTGRVTVRVVRAGNGSGLSDVLVSLDGTQLRFTDAEGRVRFDHVASGVHVVAIEERSLPPHHEVIRMSRTFVTVEPGRAPQPVLFRIAGSERRSRF